MIRFAAVVMLVLASLGLSAYAQDAATALEHYRMGDYQGAIRIGEAANNGSGLAVAARAAFAETNLRDMPCLSCLQRVESLAKRSIMLDMTHPDAFVYLAAALGYESRIIGYVRATLEHYPEMAKQAIDHALTDDPNDAFGLAALGGWHFEIVRNGGSFIARTVYGARTDLGEDAFRRAITADPGNLVVRLQDVLAMAAYDLKRYRNQIADQLAAIAMTEPRSAYEAAMKRRAARLQDLLTSDRNADFLALIKKYQGYPEA
jgi:tetratricopeptide (TPR) repeat protein